MGTGREKWLVVRQQTYIKISAKGLKTAQDYSCIKISANDFETDYSGKGIQERIYFFSQLSNETSDIPSSGIHLA